MIADDSGNVYGGGFYPSWATGTFSSYFGTDTLIGGAGMIVSTDTNGNYRWVANAGKVFVQGLLYDHAGHIYAFGNAYGYAKIGTDSVGGVGLFCAKLNLNGTPVWIKIFSDLFCSIPGGNVGGIDGAGNIYLAGNFTYPSVIPGGHTVVNAGGSSATSDIALLKTDSAGNVIWAKDIGGPGDEYPLGVAVSTSGDVYLCGNYKSPALTMGSDVLSYPGWLSYPYFFTARYDSSGNPVWARSIISRDIGCEVKRDSYRQCGETCICCRRLPCKYGLRHRFIRHYHRRQPIFGFGTVR